MSGSLDAFRGEVRDWLTANLTDELREVSAKSTSVFVDKQHTLKWQAILHKRGWVAPTWPAQYGGTGWSEAERHVFSSECALAGAPRAVDGAQRLGRCGEGRRVRGGAGG